MSLGKVPVVALLSFHHLATAATTWSAQRSTMADEERPRWPLPPNQVMGRNGAKWDKRSKGPLAEWLGTNNWMYVEVSRLPAVS